MSGIRLSLLGPPLLYPPPDTGEAFRKKTLALLAYLATEARPVARDSLAALLWPENPQTRARANLRRVVFCLRELLGEGAVLAEQDCIILDSNRLGTDLRDFMSLAGAPMNGADEGDEGLARLAAAVKLYRDRFMAGFGLADCPEYDDWQLTQSAVWGERVAAALGRLFRAYRARGMEDHAESCAKRLLALDPLDQEAHRLLMRLYAETERPELAERQFRSCAELLRTQLGMGPDFKTMGLRDELRRPPMVQAIGTFGRGLPRYESSFVGRTQESAAATELLTEPGRPVCVTGPGGVGKTRFAAELAAGIAGARGSSPAFVDLSGVDDPALVIPLWARAVGWRERAAPGERGRGAAGAAEALAALLRAKPWVVVLDNFDRVAAAAPAVLGAAAAAPGSLVIVTSRSARGFPPERELRLSPLALPPPGGPRDPRALARYPAVALLAERAEAARPGRRFAETEAAPLAALAEKLEGLPLALELAAARLRYMTPAEALERLGAVVDLKAEGWTGLPERHLSVGAAVAWSVDALPKDAARFLRALSIADGGFDLALAEALLPPGGRDACDGEEDAARAARLLDALAGRSLVERRGSPGRTRYRILNCIREYCLGGADPNEAEAARRRLAEAVLRLAESLVDAVRGRDQERQLDRLEEEGPNLGQAMAAFIGGGGAEEALRLGAALHWFWYRRGRISEGVAALKAALGAGGAAPPRLLALGLRAYGWLLFVGGDWDGAALAFAESVAAAKRGGRGADAALPLCYLGVAERWLGDRATGTRHCAEGLALARAECDERAIATALVWSFATVGGRGLDSRAEEGLEEALALSRRCGDPWLEAHALEGLGDYRRETGDYHGAAACFEAALEAFGRLKDGWMAAWSLEGLGRTELALGRVESGLARLGAGRGLFASLGDLEGAAYLLALQGRAELEDGDAELGAEMLGAYRSFTEARRPERPGVRIPPDEAAAEAMARAAREWPDAWARGRLKAIADFASDSCDRRLVGA